ncbi:hypothetical protein M885DRAFT_457454 [Pelagophyceae sp. CCMP2097]|nr:hypothetical protein M885DRAFT_457454 [Pelagophyceae sp. CCMP2097]
MESKFDGSPGGSVCGKLLDANHKRKQAEHDKQLLMNRIALLKKEEDRAWKKIQKTKGRAEEILKIRIDHENETEKRRQLSLTEIRRQKDDADRNFASEDASRAARERQMAAVTDRKRADVKSVREDAAEAREFVRLQRLDEIVAKQTRRTEMKLREDLLKERREGERLSQLESNRRAYEDRIAAQARESAEKEAEVAKMERVEMQLINQLKKTQVMQQQAFEDLEHALNGDLTKFRNAR